MCLEVKAHIAKRLREGPKVFDAWKVVTEAREPLTMMHATTVVYTKGKLVRALHANGRPMKANPKQRQRGGVNEGIHVYLNKPNSGFVPFPRLIKVQVRLRHMIAAGVNPDWSQGAVFTRVKVLT